MEYTNLVGGEATIHDPSGLVVWGPGNIDTDPCFVEAGYWDPNGTADDPNDDVFVEGNYHLKSQAGRWDEASGNWVQDEVTSPCIDAGDPNSPIMYEPFPNGGVVNMGAYGGTAQASMTPVRGPTEGRWTEPMPLYEVNTDPTEEWAPILSTDGLTLYFGRVRSPQSYDGRIFQATRPSPMSHFTSVTKVPGPLNDSNGHVLCPWVSPDELRMYYIFQPGSVFTLKVSERRSTSDPWPEGRDLSELNRLSTRLVSPYLTADELTIFFSAPDIEGTLGSNDIWMAKRSSRDAPFEQPVNLAQLNTTFKEVHSFVSSDGLTLYFASDRNGIHQLFRSTRASAEAPFGSPVHLTFFDAPGGDCRFPSLANDGSAFYFMRETGQDRTTRDIWVSYRID